MNVNHMNIKPDMKAGDLIREMGRSGVLGAGRVHRAAGLLREMIDDSEMGVFMSVAGPLVPGGMRRIIRDLIDQKVISALITSGANLTHDLLEAFGGAHYREYGFDDERLHEEGIGRIGDIYTRSEDFEVFEARMQDMFSSIFRKKPHISIQELIYEIGAHLNDEMSIIRTAHLRGVPIYAPGIIDSMLGLQLWMYTQDNRVCLDAVRDMHSLSDLVFSHERIGAVILGGGLPKHYTLASTLLRGGVDAAIQITMDRSETGSLSGAPLEEAKSWAKAQAGSNLVTVIGDATALFPLILSAALTDGD
ncbi:deoxyhypusine synthase [Methanothermobacter marburgensis]|uniref:deoxyhypusine synthase n=1 Tax=Methanothermobacter marburgensis TaxID=145263 RepID=UPI0035B7ED88